MERGLKLVLAGLILALTQAACSLPPPDQLGIFSQPGGGLLALILIIVVVFGGGYLVFGRKG